MNAAPTAPAPGPTTRGCFIVRKHSLGAALLFLLSSRPTGSPQEQVRHSTTVTMSDEEYYGIQQNGIHPVDYIVHCFATMFVY